MNPILAPLLHHGWDKSKSIKRDPCLHHKIQLHSSLCDSVPPAASPALKANANSIHLVLLHCPAKGFRVLRMCIHHPGTQRQGREDPHSGLCCRGGDALQVHSCPNELGSSSCIPLLQHPREDYSLFSLSYHWKTSGLSLIQKKLMLLSKI